MGTRVEEEEAEEGHPQKHQQIVKGLRMTGARRIHNHHGNPGSGAFDFVNVEGFVVEGGVDLR